MSRWWLLSIPLLLAVALALWVRSLSGEVTVEAGALTDASATPAVHGVSQPTAALTRPSTVFASLSGVVRRHGAPVANAEVVVRGVETLRVKTSEAGGFELELWAPQGVMVSARSENLA